MAIVSFLVILSLSLLVLGMFTQGQDVLAYKGSGVDVPKYGKATMDIVCGDEICSEPLSIQERIDKYLWETRIMPTVESIISEIEQLQNKISKLTLQLQEIQGVDFSLQQQGLLSSFRGFSSPTISPLDPIKSSEFDNDEKIIESLENPEEQAFVDEGQYIDGGRGSDNIEDGGSLEFNCTFTECTCEGSADCFLMGSKNVCGDTISCTADGSKCSCSP